MISTQRPGTTTGLCRRAAKRAFTLVEVMVATVLLSMIAVSLLSVLVNAYRVGAKARYRDHARYVIKSFAEQFMTQVTTDSSQNGAIYTMFQPTVNTITGNAMAKGTGMSWTNSDGTPGVVSTDAQQSTFTVMLADTTGSPIAATVTRQVAYLFTSTGSTTLVNQNSAAGTLLQGTFTITYPYLGVTQTDQIIAVRATP
jgi:prepilin-type N-terminal cleavage/methylation domain-containing protein